MRRELAPARPSAATRGLPRTRARTSTHASRCSSCRMERPTVCDHEAPTTPPAPLPSHNCCSLSHRAPHEARPHTLHLSLTHTLQPPKTHPALFFTPIYTKMVPIRSSTILPLYNLQNSSISQIPAKRIDTFLNFFFFVCVIQAC